MADNNPPQIPTIVWLLQSGSATPLVVGLMLAVVGMFLVIRPNRTLSLVLAIISLSPAIVGLIAVYVAAGDYLQLAHSSENPKPAEFAVLTGRAMGSSFWGLLGTLVSVFPATLALACSVQRKHATDSDSPSASGT